ncbi:hypothetical protein AC249_AIPGENE23079 [Exaiptasia diaphana]|nr:hypothetical protein AC249_AIPGENE23079 [Exaiptasia diaphana]
MCSVMTTSPVTIAAVRRQQSPSHANTNSGNVPAVGQAVRRQQSPSHANTNSGSVPAVGQATTPSCDEVVISDEDDDDEASVQINSISANPNDICTDSDSNTLDLIDRECHESGNEAGEVVPTFDDEGMYEEGLVFTDTDAGRVVQEIIGLFGHGSPVFVNVSFSEYTRDDLEWQALFDMEGLLYNTLDDLEWQALFDMEGLLYNIALDHYLK